VRLAKVELHQQRLHLERMSQGSLLFGGVDPVITPEVGKCLPPLPDLTAVESLGFDTETTTEARMEDRSLVGLSFRLPSGRKQYVPIKHPGGGNYEVENVREWAQRELKEKQLVVCNGKHEVDTMLRFGVDLEEQVCRLQDVFHSAALLNDHRYRLNLDLLCQEEFPEHHRIEANHASIHMMTAAQAAPIAIEDADLAWNLSTKYAPRIEDEDLRDVLELEDNLIYATAAMQRNGAYLDVPKLIRWNQEVQAEWEWRVLKIHSETGLRVDPGKRKDMQKLFRHFGLEETGFKTESGEESFTEEALDGITHPMVILAKECRQLASLLAKYLRPYLSRVAPDGRITYQLHQLRGDEYGTITGRYSSSKDKNGLGINVQQISKREKQPPLLQRWDIRELFIPPSGRVWASADASQIELRFLAHHAAMLGMTRLAKEYNADPWVDFHKLMVSWTGLIRDHAKNVTFAKTYGGGVDKIAWMCKVSQRRGAEIVRQYENAFPEANRLINLASEQAERVGYVRTFLGRRRRYVGTGERYYSALNSVLQGGAADLAKIKLLESYVSRRKHDLVMRYPVHDEANGDTPDAEQAQRWGELLNTQTSDLAVPIMWKVGTGQTWSEAH
jgi:DNA polymerase I-like protein with 3'-5' exonuclease and polymerase domains